MLSGDIRKIAEELTSSIFEFTEEEKERLKPILKKNVLDVKEC